MHFQEKHITRIRSAGYVPMVRNVKTGAEHVLEGLDNDQGWFKDKDGLAVRFELHSPECSCKHKEYVMTESTMQKIRAVMLQHNYRTDYKVLEKVVKLPNLYEVNYGLGDYVAAKVVDDVCLGEMDLIYVISINTAPYTPPSACKFIGLKLGQHHGEVDTVELEAWRYSKVDVTKLDNLDTILSRFVTV